MPDPSTEGNPTRVRLGVIALVMLAASSAYLTRHCLAVANTTIQEDLGIDEAQMGWVLGAFAAGYFVCQIPGGQLAGVIGTRGALSLISTLWSLFTMWTAVVSTLIPLLISRVCFGLAQAGLVPISARIIGDWFPERRRGIYSAGVGAAMSLGGVITMWLTGGLLNHFHWRQIFLMYSVVGIVWAIGFFLFFRTRPEDHPWVNPAELRVIRSRPPTDLVSGVAVDPLARDAQERELSTAAALRGMATNRTIWAINIQSFFRAAGYALFVTWFPALLQYRYELSPSAAGDLATWPLAGVIAGTLSGGVTVDFVLRRTGSKRLSRSGVAVIGLGLAALFTFLSSLTSAVELFVASMSMGAVFSGLANPSAWAATIDVSGRQTAVVFGAMNMAGTVGAIFMPVVLGYVIGDIRQTGGNWNYVVYFVTAIYFCGAAAWLAVDPADSLRTRSRPVGATNELFS